MIEKKQLFEAVSVHSKMYKYGNSSKKLTAADIRNVSQGSELTKNSYMFMRNVRGTPAYFRDSLYNLISMIKNLGCPHLFMTLSCDETNWLEVAMMLTGCSYDEAVKKVKTQDWKQSVKKDPILVLQHIERRLDSLFKNVINNDRLLPLGSKVNDYFIRREFQQRGSVHFHILLWLEKCPDVNDISQRNTLLEFIDRTISTCI